MDALICEQFEQVHVITLNRIDKHNAFDDQLLKHLQHQLEAAIHDTGTHVIVLKANGKHFSAGADLAWMQRMTHYSEEENLADAKVLAKLMDTLYQCPKPTIAMVHGQALGGGVGLVAACDVAIAAKTARFCFSEVKLGLIPAVISPYVIKAIGERAAAWLFMTAEVFDAQRAYELQLVHHCVSEEALLAHTLDYAHRVAQFAPSAVQKAKALVRQIAKLEINDTLQDITASAIARQRISPEGQKGLLAFLNKESPQ